MKNDANIWKIDYRVWNCTFQKALYWAFHISKDTVFNYCKIQVSNPPQNTLRKIYQVFTGLIKPSIEGIMVVSWEYPVLEGPKPLTCTELTTSLSLINFVMQPWWQASPDRFRLNCGYFSTGTLKRVATK